MKFRIVVDVELTEGVEFNEAQRLMLAHRLRDLAEDVLETGMEGEGSFKAESEVRGPYDSLEFQKNNPLDLRVYEDASGSDLVMAVVTTPNHQGPRGPRVFISWHAKSDLVKDYGSVEKYFRHIDGYLVDESGSFNEEEFIHTQQMGSDYTGWFEIPNVPS